MEREEQRKRDVSNEVWDMWSRWQPCGGLCQGTSFWGGGSVGGRQVEGRRLALLPGVSCSPAPGTTPFGVRAAGDNCSS